MFVHFRRFFIGGGGPDIITPESRKIHARLGLVSYSLSLSRFMCNNRKMSFFFFDILRFLYSFLFFFFLSSEIRFFFFI